MQTGLPNHQLLFAMTGACGLCGGIASANLNVLGALVELARERRAGLTIFSFAEKEGDRPDFLPHWVRFRAFQGNRSLFSVNLLRATVARPVFCFDHVGLALPLLPLAAAGMVKTIIFAHGSESWKRMRRTNRWSLQCASLSLTNSYFTLRRMREVIPGCNGEVCRLGLSPEFALNEVVPEAPADTIVLRAADGQTQILKKRVLLLVGRMDRREGEKGHRELINVMSELLEDYPDVQLVFPGPGDDRENLQELSQQKGVASSVFLPGLVTVETLQSLYRHCYAFVMPSKQEGFGLAYLEAMNYGKPCVGCFNQGAEEVIVHGETGFLLRDPSDAPELLKVLRVLLRDAELAQTLGRRGFERLHKCFTTRHVQARIKDRISKVLES